MVPGLRLPTRTPLDHRGADATIRAMPRRAYTLIETLAVLVVLGLVAALGVPALARSAGGDPVARAVAAVAAVDQRLRQSALGRGGELRFSAGRIEAWVVGDSQPLAVVDAGPVITGRLQPRGEPLRTLVIDTDGRSLDAELWLTVGERRQHVSVLGLSGEWVVEAAP
jgi:prepilin-type N-terminal cleavage/methylation domain-containing protein